MVKTDSTFRFADPVLWRRYQPLVVSVMLLCWSIPAATLLAQTKKISDYEVRRISTQDGLSSQVVSSFCTDATGMLWIGTYTGLFRFNGFRAERFDDPAIADRSLPNLLINSLETDTVNGNLLFVSTRKGTRVLDLVDGRSISDTALGLPADFLDSCVQIKKSPFGFYWALANHSVYRIDRVGNQRYSCKAYYQLPDCIYPNIVPDPTDQDGIWILPSQMDAYLLNGKGLQHFDIPKNATHASQSPGFFSLIYTRGGIICWDLARNIYRFDPVLNQFKLANHEFDLYDFLPYLKGVDEFLKQKPDLRCQLPIWAGQQLFGTHIGFYIVRKKISSFEVIEPLRGIEIRGIHTDDSGNWWAGTAASIFCGNQQNKSVERYSTRKAWDFLPLTDRLFLLALELPQGIAYWDTKLHQEIPEADLPEWISGSTVINSTLSLCRDQEGSIWAGANHSLWYAPSPMPSRFRPFSDVRSGNIPKFENVRALLPDSRSGIWAGSENGLSRIVYNATKQGYETDPAVPDLAGVYISDLYQDNNQKLWMATKGKGIACLDLNKIGAPVQWYNSANGLCNDFACRIESSNHDQVLWISTHNGISRFEVSSGVFQNYYEDSGFPSNEFNSAASAHFPDGTLLFGGVSGLVKFHPDSIPASNFQHKVILTSAKIYDQFSGSLQTINLSKLSAISLPPYPEYLEFQLGSSEFVNPSIMRFRYRLHGLSELWTYTSGEHDVKFIRLAPGKYDFEVQAIPLDGHFGKPLLLSLFVSTPYYETWWFRTLLLGIILGLVYLVYRSRVQQILNEQQIRRQIADDLHDDIGNKLNIISILAQKIAKDHPENTPKTIDLSKLIDVSRNALRSLHTMIWSVDTDKDRLLSLFSRMQDFADDYLRPLNVRFHFEMPPLIPDREINLKARHHIMLIFQELLTNMVKYAHPTMITIGISLDRDTLHINILNQHEISSDPDFIAVSSHRGLGSIERRLNRINGKFSLTDPSDTLQEIVLVVPGIFNHSNKGTQL